jgi:hypothetical protein
MASIISFTFREAVVDVEYNGEDSSKNFSVMIMVFKSYILIKQRIYHCYIYIGYLIPKGWKVLPMFRNIHHNPEFFPDPHIFDPSRFEVCDKNKIRKKSSLKISCKQILLSFVLVAADAGCSKTQHFHAIWKWRACLPWQ